MEAIDLPWIDSMTGGRVGKFDMPCPICSPMRRRVNQRKPVLAIWRVDNGFATYCCAHCGISGHTRDASAPAPDRAAIERAKAEAAERARVVAVERLDKASWEASRKRIYVIAAMTGRCLRRSAICRRAETMARQ
jgi:hypothetical protein